MNNDTRSTSDQPVDDTIEAAPWDADTRTFDCLHAFHPSRALARLRGFHGIDAPADLPPADVDDASEIGWLCRMAQDPLGGFRPPIRVSTDQIEALERLAQEMPNFMPVIDLVMTRAMASHRTRFALEVPPLLLLGPSGIGKSRFALRLAEALDTYHTTFDITVDRDADLLTGISVARGGRNIGLVARTLIESPTDAPMIFIDDIDRHQGGTTSERALDPLRSYLTEKAGHGCIDGFLHIPIMASRVIWIAAAERLETVPSSLVDLFQIVEIEPPTPSEMAIVVRTIAVETNRRLRAETVDCPIDDDAVGLLDALTPRHARRLIENATAAAVAAGRGTLTALDIEQQLKRGR